MSSRLLPLLLSPLLLLGASCGGIAFCAGWWCYAPGPCYPYCALSWDTAYGDFDGDGILDTASGTPGDSMILVRTGTGTQDFSAGQHVATLGSGSSVDFIRSGRFGADSLLDLVVVDTAAQEVRTYFGDGTASFSQAGTPFPLPSMAPLREVLVGDIDADALDDIVLFDFEGGLLVLLADGSGGFSVGTAGRADFGMGAVALALDLMDGDGLLDLVLLDANATTLSLYTGTGTGAWNLSAGPIPVTGRPRAVTIGEFNGLPGLDLAVVSGDNPSSPSLCLFFGNGSGSLMPSPQAPVPLPLASVQRLLTLPAALAPMGPSDLVAVGSIGFGARTALVGIPNQGDGTFGAPGAAVRVPPVKDMIATDLDGDARMDLLLTHEEGSGVGIAIGGTRGG